MQCPFLLILHQPSGKPFQPLYLYLCAAQLAQRLLCGLLLKVSVCRPQRGFQFRVVGRAQQMAHSFPHGIAQFCTLGKRLPRGGKVLLPYSLKSTVQVS